jgi:hypothetical protein
MTESKYERKAPKWAEQDWKTGNMLHVGLTDSHTREGLLNGVVVGQIITFGHRREPAAAAPTLLKKNRALFQ